ncbi:four helix bundle protein [Bacteroides heparinolyticus]|uniref:four helix bundle protein n=1 Tax=Prevotella heparinolytica TaxID=28113 RepID=UPI0035A09AAB
MKDNIVYEKSYSFALRIIRLYCFLKEEKREFVLSKQVLRSGTAIGALISEAKFAQSKADFINKMYIALKEANETKYWLSLLKDSSYISEEMFLSIFPEISEIVSLLVAIVKSSKENKS